MRNRGLGAVLTVALGLAGAANAQDFDGSLSAAERRAVAASGLPRAQVISIKRDLVVAIHSRGTSKGGVLFEGVQLRGEAISAEAARTLGYRSMRSTVNVDCARRRDMVLKMTIYPEANGKGEAIVRQVPGGWVQPSPSAFMSDVIASICSDAPSAPMEIARPAPPKPPPAPMQVAEVRPAPIPEPEPQLAPRAVRSPESGEVISTALSARHPRLVLPPAEPAPPPPVSEPPRPAPPPKAPPPAVAKASVAPVSPSAAPQPGPVRVQITAVSTAKAAQDALAKLGALPPPLATAVQEAKVKGRTVYRALVTGFPGRAEAKIFCEVVVEYGGVCFVR